MKLLSLPNILSLSRLPLAAAFLLVDSVVGRAVVVSAVGVTDLADGFFARRMHSHDRASGQIIDPITDKLFVLIALITFAVRGDITVPTLLLILVRDLFTTFAYFMLKARGWKIEFKARFSGKVTTVLQLAVLLALLFWQPAVPALLITLTISSVVAIVDYSRAALRQRRLAGAPDPA